MGGVLFLLKRGFGLVAAAHGVLTSTSLLLVDGGGGGLWSGVPLVAVILAVILSPDRRLPGTGSLSPQGSLLYLWWSLHSRSSQARPCPQGPLLSLWCVVPCFFPTDHTPPSGGQTDPSFLGRAAGTCSRGQMSPAAVRGAGRAGYLPLGGSSRTSPDSAASSPENKWLDLIDQNYERIDYFDSFWASVSWKQPHLRFDYFNH